MIVHETKWLIVHDDEAWERAKRLARGPFQMELLMGLESLSGHTRKASRRRNWRRSDESRDNLLAAMRGQGIPFSEKTVGGRRVLVIGDPQ